MAEFDLDALKDSLVRREAPVGREPPTTVPREHLETMAAAADEVLDCIRVLDKGGANLVGDGRCEPLIVVGHPDLLLGRNRQQDATDHLDIVIAELIRGHDLNL